MDSIDCPTKKVTVAHAASIFLARGETISKIDQLVGEAASQGAELVAFAEVFLAGYLNWNGVPPPIDTRGFHERLVRSSIRVSDPDLARPDDT